MADVTIEQVEQLASQLSPEDRRTLAARLVSGADRRGERSPRSLRGIMRGVWPADADLDRLLGEIRSQWTRKLDA